MRAARPILAVVLVLALTLPTLPTSQAQLPAPDIDGILQGGQRNASRLRESTIGAHRPRE